MDIQQYIHHLKEIHRNIIEFINNETESNDDYQNLINFFEEEKISEDQDKLYVVLRLLLKIYNNHCRKSGVSDKIKKLFLYFFSAIKKIYSNLEIIDIFKASKFIFLFLIENKIITLDQSIIDQLDGLSDDFLSYFYPELKNILDEKSPKLIKPSPEDLDNFDEKRKTGENCSHICSLIRDDSVEDFISYLNRNSISLSSHINPSIFETNDFLIGKKVTLIEYAAFYGSIQIFQYLKLNNVILTPSLWLFTIHGKNAEIIHLLEENDVETNDEEFNGCLYESVKCHHNDFVNYFMNKMSYKTNNNFLDCCFHYDNFEYFPENIDCSLDIYLIKYDYIEFVKLLVDKGEFDINQSIISFQC